MFGVGKCGLALRGLGGGCRLRVLDGLRVGGKFRREEGREDYFGDGFRMGGGGRVMLKQRKIWRWRFWSLLFDFLVPLREKSSKEVGIGCL